MKSLQRRLLLGIELGPGAQPVAARVRPGGIGRVAGLEPGDRIVAIDGIPTPTMPALRSALRAGGRRGSVKVAFERDGHSHESSAPVIRAPLPRDGELHDAIERDGVRLRTIVRRPEGKAARAHPAIVFAQGLGIASVEALFPDLFASFARAGFATLRLERRGIGDSEGEPPEDTSLDVDVADLRATLVAIRAYDFVDADWIILLGHSIGGMLAPPLDADDLVRAYVVYGSSAEPWLDCVEASARRQAALRGDARADARARAIRAAMLRDATTDGRPAGFHRALHEAGIAAAWTRVRRPVLSLHGEHDWVVGRDEAARIAELANGAFRVVPALDHLFGAHDTLADSLREYGRGRPGGDAIAAACAGL